MSDNPQAIEEQQYPLVSDTGKKYRYIEPGLREYESGSLYRERQGDIKGHLVSGPPSAIITVDNAKDMQLKSLESRREQARQGFREALKDNRQITAKRGQEARHWGYVLGEAALRVDRSQVRALELVGEQVLDMKPRQDADSSHMPQGKQIADEFVDRILERMAEVKRRQQLSDIGTDDGL